MTATTHSPSAPAATITAPRRPIRAVAIDVDGTLLTSQHTLSPRTETALRAVIKQGIEVILATGKTRNAGQWLIDKLGLKSPGIYLQGLYIVAADGTVLHQQTLSPSVARQVITYAEDRGFTLVAYSGMKILTRVASQEAEKVTKKYHEPVPEAVGALQNILGDVPIHKLLAVGDPRQIAALRWQLGVQLGGAARLMQAGLPNMLEILPPGSSKAVGLRRVLKDLKIDPAETLAIGDAENDIEMIELAGIGVAMGNAAPNVKAVADHITASNDEDGVALVLETHVLPPKPALAAVPAGILAAASSVDKPVDPAPVVLAEAAPPTEKRP